MRCSSRLAAGLLVVVVLLASCSSGKDEGDGTGARAETATTLPATYAFTLTGAGVQAMAPAAPPFPEDVKAAVKATLDAYLGTAVVAPLRTGQPPAGLEGVFTAAAAPRLAVPEDRAALVEDGSISGEVTQDRAEANLTALTGPGGEVGLVAAQLHLAVTVTSGKTRLATVRTGEMVLVPENGAWRIDSYHLRTTRDAPPPGATP